jgi:hypothetical protein
MTRRGTGLVEAVVAALLTALVVVSALGSLARLQRSVGGFVGRRFRVRLSGNRTTARSGRDLSYPPVS